MTIEVDEQTADIIHELQERARVRRLAFDVYLRTLVPVEPLAKIPGDERIPERFKQLLSQLAEQTETPAMILPPDFSREDIYNDHD